MHVLLCDAMHTINMQDLHALKIIVLLNNENELNVLGENLKYIKES